MVRKHKRRLRSKVFTKKRGKTIVVGKGNLYSINLDIGQDKEFLRDTLKDDKTIYKLNSKILKLRGSSGGFPEVRFTGTKKNILRFLDAEFDEGEDFFNQQAKKVGKRKLNDKFVVMWFDPRTQSWRVLKTFKTRHDANEFAVKKRTRIIPELGVRTTIRISKNNKFLGSAIAQEEF